MSATALKARTFDELFGSLIWPAIGGNVAWAFFTLLVQEDHKYHWKARLLILVLVALYVVAAWMRDEQKTKHIVLYRILDGALSVAIAVFAITIQAYNADSKQTAWWVNHSLAFAFAVVGIGHLGIWNSYRDWRKRIGLVLANTAAVYLALTAPLPYSTADQMLRLLIAVGIVLFAWVVVWLLDDVFKIWPDRQATQDQPTAS